MYTCYISSVGIRPRFSGIGLFRPIVPGLASVGLRRLAEFFRSAPSPAVSSRHQTSFVALAQGGSGAILTESFFCPSPLGNTLHLFFLGHGLSICPRSNCPTRYPCGGVFSVVSCFSAILVLMAQTEIGLGETSPRLPCLRSRSGTRRRNMLSMTAGLALGELVPSFLLPPTRVGSDMGGSLVALSWCPIPLAGSWVLGVSVLSFLEAVVVVRVAVLMIWRPASFRFLVLRS